MKSDGTDRGRMQDGRHDGEAIEALLAEDRLAPLPELPEADFTTAAVARLLAQRDGVARPTQARTPAAAPETMLWVGAATTAAALVGYALLHGVSPWWLLAEPLMLLPLIPILHKGVH